MIDMTRHIAAKSDQLNADDLIGRPRTITITGVREYSADDQPIGLNYEGDNGKPYKPCKGMRRALVFLWGDNAADYVGKSLTLFNDPNVTWGGEKVGGIRISHASHIPGPQTFPISTSKVKRVQYTVEPLAGPRPRRSLDELVAAYEATVGRAEDLDALAAITGGEGAGKLRAKVEAEGGDKRDELLGRMASAGSARYTALSPTVDDGIAGLDYDNPDDELDDAFPEGGVE